jgi:aspartate--ammonia ligase
MPDYLIIPKGYKTKLNGYDTQRAIESIKQLFQKNLSRALNLKRVSAPLFVEASSGLNDDLNGVERAVSFTVSAAENREFQIVHSLAKWKRWALKKYDFFPGNGLYTDMNAIRRDEPVLDNLHSVYVDQWDWEKVITEKDRNFDYLKETVKNIVSAICITSEELKSIFPQIDIRLDPDVFFITSQELEDMYPNLSPSERENEITKLHNTVFLMQIGKILKSGKKHDGRAPDYDDWELNGDILFRNDLLDRAFEISSMGIRVDPSSLINQLKQSGCEHRLSLPFHKALANGELPLSIGGGIGQSRLCMLLMGCAHIGEVQSGVWNVETQVKCRDAGIVLL